MRRRDLLRKGTAAAGLAASRKVLEPLTKAASLATMLPTVPKRRLGKTGIDLSIIALGGVAVMDTEQGFANNLVAEAFDGGINYFDVAPSYSNAQERLGPALEPYRRKAFLACKTLKRDNAGAAAATAQATKLLRTDHLHPYQPHALTR